MTTISANLDSRFRDVGLLANTPDTKLLSDAAKATRDPEALKAIGRNSNADALVLRAVFERSRDFQGMQKDSINISVAGNKSADAALLNDIVLESEWHGGAFEAVAKNENAAADTLKNIILKLPNSRQANFPVLSAIASNRNADDRILFWIINDINIASILDRDPHLMNSVVRHENAGEFTLANAVLKACSAVSRHGAWMTGSFEEMWISLANAKAVGKDTLIGIHEWATTPNARAAISKRIERFVA